MYNLRGFGVHPKVKFRPFLVEVHNWNSVNIVSNSSIRSR